MAMPATGLEWASSLLPMRKYLEESAHAGFARQATQNSSRDNRRFILITLKIYRTASLFPRIEQILGSFMVDPQGQRDRLEDEIVASKLSSAPSSARRFRVTELNLKTTPNF